MSFFSEAVDNIDHVDAVLLFIRWIPNVKDEDLQLKMVGALKDLLVLGSEQVRDLICNQDVVFCFIKVSFSSLNLFFS